MPPRPPSRIGPSLFAWDFCMSTGAVSVTESLALEVAQLPEPEKDLPPMRAIQPFSLLFFL